MWLSMEWTLQGPLRSTWSSSIHSERGWHDEEAVLKSMATAEDKKILKNQPICEAAGWRFSPLSFHPWGGMGPLGSGLLCRLVKQALGDRQGWSRQHMEMDIWQRISASLMMYVAEQLSPVLSVKGVDPLPPTITARASERSPALAATTATAVAAVDMVGWQRAGPNDEGTFVGPIRIQCTRPSP
jgi:hypothetical protein